MVSFSAPVTTSALVKNFPLIFVYSPSGVFTCVVPSDGSYRPAISLVVGYCELYSPASTRVPETVTVAVCGYLTTTQL